MLGAIGASNRMDGTVISDAVNLADRVECATKLYGCRLLITEHTHECLAHKTNFMIREIDRVQVKGKTQPVTLFEVFDGDPEELRHLKQQTSVVFHQGIHQYRSANFREALTHFTTVLRANPGDRTAQLYVERCDNYLEKGIPNDWSWVGALDH